LVPIIVASSAIEGECPSLLPVLVSD
jgi:hypothetical protein